MSTARGATGTATPAGPVRPPSTGTRAGTANSGTGTCAGTGTRAGTASPVPANSGTANSGTVTRAGTANSGTASPGAANPLPTGPDLAAMARLLGDGTRATFCMALLDGRAWTPTELARQAGVAPSTATEHLNAMVAGGLLADERQGRHRYVRLAGPQIAELIEVLAAAAPVRPAPVPHTLSADSRRRALAHARTCYDHLAGRVGVAIADAMTERALVDWQHGLRLTPGGERWLADLGIEVPATVRRPALRPCLDWTERRPHLAGAVGAALCGHALDNGWIRRVGTTRAVVVTPAGADVFGERLGLSEGILIPAS